MYEKIKRIIQNIHLRKNCATGTEILLKAVFVMAWCTLRVGVGSIK